MNKPIELQDWEKTHEIKGIIMNDPHKHNWVGSIETHSGIKFNIENPTVEMVHLDDIARSLSFTCRYNGQIPSFYSVAEHSCLVADWLVDHGYEHLAFAGLMHDAAEAYIGDIVRPMKLIPEFAIIYNEFERLVETVIGEKFNVDLYPIDPIVKEADKAVYEWEVENIRTEKVKGQPPETAHTMFLNYFNWYQPPENFTRESQMKNNTAVPNMTDAEMTAQTRREDLFERAYAELENSLFENARKEEMDDTPAGLRRQMLMNAADLVDGDRNAQYGDPRQDFQRTAKYWNAHINGIIERKVDADGNLVADDLLDMHDVAIMMSLLKISRLAWDPTKEDTWTDLAGYAACGWHCAAPEDD